MTDLRLQRECDVLCRYLIGTAATPYVSTNYVEFHNRGRFKPNRFDQLLIRIASAGPLLARFADTYASRFARRAILRQKLVLLLALLESATPSSEYVDTPRGRSLFIRMAAETALYLAMLAAGTVLLGPAHWMLSRRRTAA
jgi:hypothetical protein